MCRIIAITLMLALTGAVHAQGKSGKEAVQMGGGKPVSEQIRDVEVALGSERYSELTPEDKSAVQKSLNVIRQQMDGQERVDQVAEQKRVTIFNEQEKINTILTRGHADSRLVCRREKTVGSNFPNNVCLTVAQRRAAEEAARTTMRDASRSQMRPLE